MNLRTVLESVHELLAALEIDIDSFVDFWVDCDLAGENLVLAGKAGAIDAVVAAMRAHVDNAGVSEPACGALSCICLNNGAFCSSMSIILRLRA